MPSGPKKRQAARRKKQQEQQHLQHLHDGNHQHDRDSVSESLDEEDHVSSPGTPTASKAEDEQSMSPQTPASGNADADSSAAAAPHSVDLSEKDGRLGPAMEQQQKQINTEEWVRESRFDVGTPPKQTPAKLIREGEEEEDDEHHNHDHQNEQQHLGEVYQKDHLREDHLGEVHQKDHLGEDHQKHLEEEHQKHLGEEQQEHLGEEQQEEQLVGQYEQDHQEIPGPQQADDKVIILEHHRPQDKDMVPIQVDHHHEDNHQQQQQEQHEGTKQQHEVSQSDKLHSSAPACCGVFDWLLGKSG